jgi:hypothetical protein
VIEILLWALPRFLIVAMPLLVALMAGQRAFLSVSRGTGRTASVWMGFSGFACVSGLSLLPWAMHLQPINGAGLVLSALAVSLWPVLGVILRRSPESDGAGAAPVFRHAVPDDAWRAAIRVPVPSVHQDHATLPFVPTAARVRLQ